MTASPDRPNVRSIGDRVAALREQMRARNIDYYVVPSSDDHQSEYVPDCWQRRPWITGFSGSMGDALVGLDGAWLWADSRYWLQADDQLDPEVWRLVKMGARDVPKMHDWLANNAAGRVVGLDPKVMGLKAAKSFADAIEGAGGTLELLEDNLIDAVWSDRPELPLEPAVVWPDRFAGRSVADKLGDVREALAKEASTALVVTTLDAVAWLFNVRGSDVSFNPVLVSYALVTGETATLFVDSRKVDAEVRAQLVDAGVTLAEYDAFGRGLDRLSSGRVWVDETYGSRWVVDRLESAGADVHTARSPLMLLKAVKNDTEQDGMRAAHVRDGAAVVRYLYWLRSAWQGGELDEIAASDQLERYRTQREHFRGLSFDTISGFAGNGAIVHYRATPESAKVLDDSALYLVDSGGQYLDGTTDITRTVHLGTSTATEREHYTRVLRGHLALRHARFPRGTSGGQLDALARVPLWEAGLSYGHGTGHGVGCYLNVHQGPHGISTRYTSVALEPGMVVSNEPGYYLEGAYGIRIENLCLVVEDLPERDGEEPYYAFEDLTLAPYARDPIDVAQLSRREIGWVDAYHALVFETLAPLLPEAEREWLRAETAPLEQPA